MKHILFVDDDPRVLDGLRRILYPLRTEWQTSFANSGPEALDLLSKQKFDVLVTDIRMPEMNGTELLAQVRERYPEVVRIILSGQADQDLTLRVAATAHQYLSKPCDAETIRRTVKRASALRDLLAEPSLRALVLRAKSLPSVPALYTELVAELESEDSSVDTVAGIIARDTAMTAKTLQLANSAFFGLPRHVVDPKEAVLHLGFDTVKALTLSIKVFSQFKSGACSRFSIEELSRHSVITGTLARKIAERLGLPRKVTEDAFMAGLLHDVGKLILVDTLPKEYDRAITHAERTGTSYLDAEREVFGATHADVGTYLLWIWGMSDEVVEAVTYHHSPGSCPDPRLSPLAAVHVANVLSSRLPEYKYNGPPHEFDTQYLDALTLPTSMDAWGEILEGTTVEYQTR